MIDEMAPQCGKTKVHITVLPKKTEGGNPDFRVWDGKSKITGYIEAKKPDTDLDDVEDSEQLKRYRDTFPNLILTNFLEFRFYRDGQLMDSTFIGRKHTLVKRKLTLDDIQHYIKIARALQLTIHYQELIDDIYHGVEKNLI